MKIALITGISGQDGSYLTEYLLSKGYEVHGLVRKIALEDPSHRLWRLKNVFDKIILHAANIESYQSIFKIMQKIKPDECYHLASESFVSYLFEDEYSTIKTNINGIHNILSSLKDACPECKLYFAGSSEMFGNAEESPQNEKSRFNPRSIYGISKVAGYQLVKNYRNQYGLFTCSGILFNHESPRRGFEFVTRKISSSIARINKGLANEIRLGNIDSERDWGFSGDYVVAMHSMLQQEKPIDVVVATGQSFSVRDFLKIGFDEVGLNYKDYVKIDNRFYRPSEKVKLIGDASKAKKHLNWTPTINFQELVLMMVKSDIDALQEKN